MEVDEETPSSSYLGEEDETEESRSRFSNDKRSHRKNSSGRKRHHHHHRHLRGENDMNERMRRYLYSAISATFFFVLLRELGWVDQMQNTLSETDFSSIVHKQQQQHHHSSGGGSMPSLAAAAANMAASSMKGNNAPKRGGSTENMLLQNPQNFISRSEMMDHATLVDNSIPPGSRPIMYTFFEWIPPRSRGTSMSDSADKKLITEWKAAWKAAGWHPIVLTLADAKKHTQYADYAPKLNKIPMLGVDGLGGTVIYNQLCFLRWLAVAAAGGGFLCDYDVFPVSLAPKSSSATTLPYSGNFTVYSRIKHSKRAGIPCLMSGRTSEWTRMAYGLLENGKKNAGTETMWSDMLALIDMRNDDMYTVYDAVLEGQDVLTKKEWSAADCNKTESKLAIHFSHEALKLGYLPPGETAEDRPEIVKRFLSKWHSACGSQAMQKVFGDEGKDVA